MPVKVQWQRDLVIFDDNVFDSRLDAGVFQNTLDRHSRAFKAVGQIWVAWKSGSGCQEKIRDSAGAVFSVECFDQSPKDRLVFMC
jgi:hypothetical protein